jgi:hypothetical protein
VAGEANFTRDEWRTMRRAVSVVGVVVSLAEGGGDDMREELFAITQHLRGARMTHANQLVRELAGMPFQSGLQPGMSREAYERTALEVVRAATATVATRAPGDLEAFRGFVLELAEVAANAHREGGFMGMGGVQVTAAEEAAIERVKRAAGIV